MDEGGFMLEVEVECVCPHCDNRQQNTVDLDQQYGEFKCNSCGMEYFINLKNT